jgi:hypothetical protein
MKSARFFWRDVTHRKDLGLALLGCAIGVAAAELAIPWLLRQVIDTALGEISHIGLNVLGLWSCVGTLRANRASLTVCVLLEACQSGATAPRSDNESCDTTVATSGGYPHSPCWLSWQGGTER